VHHKIEGLTANRAAEAHRRDLEVEQNEPPRLTDLVAPPAHAGV
jgi:hypothetical protein